MTLDGTYFPVNESYLFDKSLYSHKLNAAGIMYDVATNIVTDNIVYWSGGGKEGLVPDITIARNGIVHLIDEGKRL